ncbi:hypothetical protein PDIG_06400 [Penicillium digitatum PHI26]|uniref:Uncharacterized protein n=2 Tax=Penicillium digitatum TaxID=36651 RepID=K9GAH7_PEND2|nr:hypothetical protein PDIP_11070 [Penicillium digitatum Pd1]EKV18925.1 hypothetical protein PDIG_06400 [Penicillium digitatum PHI26]EKV20977.1 hypothetical protein PDIP_11070 [Penicillium digitatum Pd1]
MPNKWSKIKDAVLTHANGYKKLVRPSVALHKTAFPKTAADLESLGVRFDFAGTIEEDPNFLEAVETKTRKGTHGIVATVKIPDGGTKEDVQAALDAVDSEID